MAELALGTSLLNQMDIANCCVAEPRVYIHALHCETRLVEATTQLLCSQNSSVYKYPVQVHCAKRQKAFVLHVSQCKYIGRLLTLLFRLHNNYK